MSVKTGLGCLQESVMCSEQLDCISLEYHFTASGLPDFVGEANFGSRLVQPCYLYVKFVIQCGRCHVPQVHVIDRRIVSAVENQLITKA